MDLFNEFAKAFAPEGIISKKIPIIDLLELAPEVAMNKDMSCRPGVVEIKHGGLDVIIDFTLTSDKKLLEYRVKVYDRDGEEIPVRIIHDDLFEQFVNGGLLYEWN